MSSSCLVTTKLGNVIKVNHENGTYLGDFIMKEDGYYDFWPELRGGYWPSYLLRELANALDLLNEEWDKTIQNDPVLNAPNTC